MVLASGTRKTWIYIQYAIKGFLRIPLALFSLRSCVVLLARGAAYRKKKGFEKAKMNNKIFRLIEKVKSVVKDELLAKLLSSFCNLPILDSSGKDWSVKTGIPPVVFISSIQKNLFLDDLDREVEVRFPNLQYARFLALLALKRGVVLLFDEKDIDSILFP